MKSLRLVLSRRVPFTKSPITHRSYIAIWTGVFSTNARTHSCSARRDLVRSALLRSCEEMEVLCVGTADTKLEELLFLAAQLRSALAATGSDSKVYPIRSLRIVLSSPGTPQ